MLHQFEEFQEVQHQGYGWTGYACTVFGQGGPNGNVPWEFQGGYGNVSPLGVLPSGYRSNNGFHGGAPPSPGRYGGGFIKETWEGHG